MRPVELACRSHMRMLSIDGLRTVSRDGLATCTYRMLTFDGFQAVRRVQLACRSHLRVLSIDGHGTLSREGRSTCTYRMLYSDGFRAPRFFGSARHFSDQLLWRGTVRERCFVKPYRRFCFYSVSRQQVSFRYHILVSPLSMWTVIPKRNTFIGMTTGWMHMLNYDSPRDR